MSGGQRSRADITYTPEELSAWADEAQACIDSGCVIVTDHRKAHATVMALRSHAALQARVEKLTKVAQMAKAAAEMELGFAASPDFSPREMLDAANSALAIPLDDKGTAA